MLAQREEQLCARGGVSPPPEATMVCVPVIDVDPRARGAVLGVLQAMAKRAHSGFSGDGGIAAPFDNDDNGYGFADLLGFGDGAQHPFGWLG